jgi:hypothetical protein
MRGHLHFMAGGSKYYQTTGIYSKPFESQGSITRTGLNTE